MTVQHTLAVRRVYVPK